MIYSCKKSAVEISETDIQLPNNWKRVVSGKTNLLDVFFIDSLNGYCLNNNEILKSKDGGQTWTILKTIPLTYNSGNIPGIYNLFCTTDNYLFVISSKYLYRFKNDVYLDSTRFSNLNDVYFIDGKTGYATDSGYLKKSVDSGKSWSKIKISNNPFGFSNCFSLFFLDNKTGWVSNGEQLIFSFNSDTTWFPSDSKFKGFIQSIFAASKDVIFLSDTLDVYKSTNGGSSFIPLKRNLSRGSYTDIHFVNTEIGYYCDKNFIYKTIDSGKTWKVEVQLYSDTIVEIHFTDINHGWACTSKGDILVYKK